MDENTRLHIAVCIDMAVVSSSCDTASDELTVVLEVHNKDLFVALIGTDLTQSVIDIFSLLNRRHQLRCSVHADRHEVEIPAVTASVLDQKIQELVTCNGLEVCSCVADGSTKKQTVFFHQIHGCQNFIENTLAAASVVDLLEAFQRQGEGDIAELLNRLTELLVDQGSIGEAVEFTVMMLFCQTQDVFFAHKRFAAGEHVEVGSQLFSLAYDIRKFLIGKIQLVAVFCCPASGAVQVTGTCRVHQHRPWDVAVVFFTVHTDLFRSDESCLESQVQSSHFDHLRIQLVQSAVDILYPFVVRILQHGADVVERFLRKHISSKFLYKIRQIQQCFCSVISVVHIF